MDYVYSVVRKDRKLSRIKGRGIRHMPYFRELISILNGEGVSIEKGLYETVIVLSDHELSSDLIKRCDEAGYIVMPLSQKALDEYVLEMHYV
jgi:hypothetical protein